MILFEQHFGNLWGYVVNIYAYTDFKPNEKVLNALDMPDYENLMDEILEDEIELMHVSPNSEGLGR